MRAKVYIQELKIGNPCMLDKQRCNALKILQCKDHCARKILNKPTANLGFSLEWKSPYIKQVMDLITAYSFRIQQYIPIHRLFEMILF